VKITTHDLRHSRIQKSRCIQPHQDKAGVKVGEMKQQQDGVQDILEQKLEALTKEGIV
jgi:hypothetical protein